MLILLAKQPPPGGIRLCPLAKGLFLLGLLAVYTSRGGLGTVTRPSPEYPAAPFHLLHATLPEVHASSGRGEGLSCVVWVNPGRRLLLNKGFLCLACWGSSVYIKGPL